MWIEAGGLEIKEWMLTQVIVHEDTKTKYAMGYINGTLFSEWVTGRVLGEGPLGEERGL